MDWPEGVFPRRAIVSSDCVFPLVRPIGCIVAQNGILCANDIPLKVSMKKVWPEGVFPRRAIGKESERNELIWDWLQAGFTSPSGTPSGKFEFEIQFSAHFLGNFKSKI